LRKFQFTCFDLVCSRSEIQRPAKPDNKEISVITVDQLRAAYASAAANGETNEQLATTLGIKLQSLQQALTTARKDLRDIGTTEDELKLIFPPLKRRSGPRTSKRAAALLAMRDEARQAAEAKAAAEAAAPPEGEALTDSELEALTAPV
jgi:predicted DNA binding protein